MVINDYLKNPQMFLDHVKNDQLDVDLLNAMRRDENFQRTIANNLKSNPQGGLQKVFDTVSGLVKQKKAGNPEMGLLLENIYDLLFDNKKKLKNPIPQNPAPQKPASQSQASQMPAVQKSVKQDPVRQTPAAQNPPQHPKPVQFQVKSVHELETTHYETPNHPRPYELVPIQSERRTEGVITAETMKTLRPEAEPDTGSNPFGAKKTYSTKPPIPPNRLVGEEAAEIMEKAEQYLEGKDFLALKKQFNFKNVETSVSSHEPMPADTPNPAVKWFKSLGGSPQDSCPIEYAKIIWDKNKYQLKLSIDVPGEHNQNLVLYVDVTKADILKLADLHLEAKKDLKSKI